MEKIDAGKITITGGELVFSERNTMPRKNVESAGITSVKSPCSGIYTFA